jgi:hypothetical protein
MSARLSWQTACELGFRGNLDEWERSMDAAAKRYPPCRKKRQRQAMLRRMKERIQLGRVVSPPFGGPNAINLPSARLQYALPPDIVATR